MLLYLLSGIMILSKAVFLFTGAGMADANARSDRSRTCSIRIDLDVSVISSGRLKRHLVESEQFATPGSVLSNAQTRPRALRDYNILTILY